MSEITETEIKSMTKEQNYMLGYRDGKSDVLDKIRAEIKHFMYELNPNSSESDYACNYVLEIIDKILKEQTT